MERFLILFFFLFVVQFTKNKLINLYNWSIVCLIESGSHKWQLFFEFCLWFFDT